MKKLSGRSAVDIGMRALPDSRAEQMEVAKEDARGAVNEAQKLASWQPEGPFGFEKQGSVTLDTMFPCQLVLTRPFDRPFVGLESEEAFRSSSAQGWQTH